MKTPRKMNSINFPQMTRSITRNWKSKLTSEIVPFWAYSAEQLNFLRMTIISCRAIQINQKTIVWIIKLATSVLCRVEREQNNKSFSSECHKKLAHNTFRVNFHSRWFWISFFLLLSFLLSFARGKIKINVNWVKFHWVEKPFCALSFSGDAHFLKVK